MTLEIRPYCDLRVEDVERATIFAIGRIAAEIAALPHDQRSEYLQDARCMLAEKFARLGRGTEFVQRWVDVSIAALELLIATQEGHLRESKR